MMNHQASVQIDALLGRVHSAGCTAAVRHRLNRLLLRLMHTFQVYFDQNKDQLTTESLRCTDIEVEWTLNMSRTEQ